MEMHAHQWRESRCRDGCSRLNLIAEISPQDLSDDDIIKFITLGILDGNFSVLHPRGCYIYIYSEENSSHLDQLAIWY
jgi:hypothetical protein